MKLTWKNALIALGGLALAAGIGALALRSQTVGCGGVYVMGRWSLPFFWGVVSVMVIGAVVGLIGLAASERIAKAVAQNALMVGISVGVTLLVLDITMRLTHAPLAPPRGLF